jgi:hypothetical protein
MAVVIENPIQDIIVSDMPVSHGIKVFCNLGTTHSPIFIVESVEPLDEESTIDENCHFHGGANPVFRLLYPYYTKMAQGSACPLSSLALKEAIGHASPRA